MKEPHECDPQTATAFAHGLGLLIIFDTMLHRIKLFIVLSFFRLTFLHAQTALDNYIISQMNAKHISGVSACVIKDGKLAWQGYYGLANRATLQPVTANTGFMLASISKTITATALMQLFEEDSFALDDNINNYLPFSVINPNFPDSVITFRQLLTHTSSIRDNWSVLSNVYSDGDSPIPLGQFMGQYLSDTGFYYNAAQNFYNYPPQTTYNYCNEGAALCGYLTEIISGIPFNQYCNTHIFQPVCMQNTAWLLGELDSNLVAHPYSYSGGTYHDQGLYGYPDYPDGQLRTTCVSLAKFLWMNMNDGNFDGVQILDSATMALMRTPQFPLIDPTQGLIWYKYTDSYGTWWGHNGGDAGVSTDMYFNPVTETGLIVLTNGDANHDNIWYAILDSSATMQTADAPSITCDLSSFIPVNNSVSECAVFPNPFHSTSFLSVNSYLPDADLFFYDMEGRAVKIVRHIQEGKTIITRDDLPDGIYFYKLMAGRELFASGKIIVY